MYRTRARGVGSLAGPAHSPARANRVNASVISRTASSRSASVVPKARLDGLSLLRMLEDCWQGINSAIDLPSSSCDCEP